MTEESEKQERVRDSEMLWGGTLHAAVSKCNGIFHRMDCNQYCLYCYTAAKYFWIF